MNRAVKNIVLSKLDEINERLIRIEEAMSKPKGKAKKKAEPVEKKED